MAEPWDSLSPEAQAELQGYVTYAGNTGSEFRDALLSGAANAYAGMGDAYQGFLTGRNMPQTPTGGTMETTVTTSDPQIGPPDSMNQALLKHSAAEGAERAAEHWRQAATAPDAGSDPSSGMDAYRSSFNAEPGTGASQGFYGVGAPSQGTQPTQDAASPSQPGQDSHGPEL